MTVTRPRRIVIDAGAAKWGDDESIPALIAEFDPDMLLAFDPGSGIHDARRSIPGGKLIAFRQQAVWTHNGHVNFVEANLGGHVADGGQPVSCVDLADVIEDLSPDYADIIVKLDIEGGEYEILPHLRARDADLKISLLLVEWHCERCGYGIWNKVHPRQYVEDGETKTIPCPGDLDAWLERRNRVESMMRCETREWTL